MAGKKPEQGSSSNKVTGPASYFPSIERTYGRPIADWKELIRASPLERHMELVNWLKTEHGMGHGYAMPSSPPLSPRTPVFG